MPDRGLTYICKYCGFNTFKWYGKCPQCGEWDALVEKSLTDEKSVHPHVNGLSKSPISLKDIALKEVRRYKTGIGEFDRVLGDGVVPGSLVLIGGEPGLGKSTLLLQIADCYAKFYGAFLYVSGEESIEQLKYRAERLGVNGERIYLCTETCMEKVVEYIQQVNPSYLLLDSIHTTFTRIIQSLPGTINQIREVAVIALELAKLKGITCFLIGHVTKEGIIAGPKLLEHMVDTVLYLEKGGTPNQRILRTEKNRFGPPNEVGLFSMEANGLREIELTADYFLSGISLPEAGSVVISILEGTRPVFVEVQALVSSGGCGFPKNTVSGIDSNRVALMMAVLEKKLGFRLHDKEVILNVTGGIKIYDPSADLGVITAIMSSLLDKPVNKNAVFIGEVGLLGEIKPVDNLAVRVISAARQGFAKCMLPSTNVLHEKNDLPKGMEIIALESVRELMDICFI